MGTCWKNKVKARPHLAANRRSSKSKTKSSQNCPRNKMISALELALQDFRSTLESGVVQAHQRLILQLPFLLPDFNSQFASCPCTHGLRCLQSICRGYAPRRVRRRVKPRASLKAKPGSLGPRRIARQRL